MRYLPDFSSRFRILKGGKISLVVSAFLAGSTMSFAAPSGGTVSNGSATINQNGSITTINQSTNKASINWQDFSIGKTETVNFVQPSAQSVTLNRVVGTTQSLIEGAMNANGQVFLLNPNGVLFANGSQINVGGLVASTLNITDANFQAGNYTFEGNSQNSIINMGTITANNGYVAMMGKHVANEGTIVATMGNVQLASGEKISLNLNGNSLVKLTIDQGTMDALVENKGLIRADGGQVYLTTQALNTILDGMVNNTGIIEAKTLNDVTGNIQLLAQGGTVEHSGTIDVSSDTAKGGTATVTGYHTMVTYTGVITADGTTGGGTVQVGGSYQNSDTSVYQATETIVQNGAKLTANATDNGDGGTVVAWSDVTKSDSVTRAYGTFEAKGGSNGGDGGRIETSGYNLFVDGITANTLAPKGENGDWLLDPADLYIKKASEVTSTGGANWTSSTDVSTVGYSVTGYVRDSDVTNAFNFGNVTVYGDKNLYVDTGANLSYSSNNSLTLKAGYTMEINGKIANSGSGAINLTYALINSGTRYISGTGAISTSGDLTIKASNGTSGFYGGILSGNISAANITFDKVEVGLSGTVTSTNTIQLTNYAHININSTTGAQNVGFGGAGGVYIKQDGTTIGGINSTSVTLDVGTYSTSIGTKGGNASYLYGSGGISFNGSQSFDAYSFNPSNTNRFTGYITINNGGETSIGTSSSVYDVSNTITVFSGGILHANNITLSGTLSLGGELNLESGLTTITRAASLTMGKLTGSGNLKLLPSSGTQTYTFGTSTSTFGGTLTVGSGATAYLSTANGAGTDGIISVASGGALYIASGITTPSGKSITLAGSGNSSYKALQLAGSGTIGGNITLGGDTTIQANNGGLTFSGTINGGYGLTINSSQNVTFNGNVGTTTALASITTDATGSTIFGGTASTEIKTSGKQTYNDEVSNSKANTLTLTMTSTTSGGLAFNNTLRSWTNSAITLQANSGGLNATSTINTGTGALTLGGTSAGAISVGGNITAGALTLKYASALTLSGTSNNVTSLAASNFSSGVNLNYTDADALTLLGVATVGTGSKMNISTTTGDLTINGAVTAAGTAADALVLNADTAKNAGDGTGGNIKWTSGAITVGTGGKAILYTGSVSGSTGMVAASGKPFVTASGKFRYNSDESSSGYTTALGTGLNLIYREQPTLSATATFSKTYDGAEVTAGTFAWVTQNGDTTTQLGIDLSGAMTTWGGTVIGAKNAGTYTVNATVNGTFANGLGYLSPTSIITPDATATINKKALTITATKTYDGLTDVASSTTLSGLIGSETLTISSATASSKDVATASKYISAITLTDGTNGGLAGNYSLPALSYNATNNSVTINAKEVGLSAVHTYNNSTTLSSGEITVNTGVTVGGLTEKLALSGTVLAKDANVIYSGGDSNNYIASGITLANGTATTGYSAGTSTNYVLPSLTARSDNNKVTITPATLTLVGTKTYDGTSTFTSGITITGLVSSQTITGYTATANDSNVVTTNKYFTSFTKTAGTAVMTNYKITDTYDATKNKITINAKALTSLTGTREYDGTTTVNGSAFTVTTANGMIAGDSITITGSATTTSANANTTAYTPSASNLTLSNSNYTKPANASITITKKTLTLNDLEVADKTYNGATTASTIGNYGTLSGKIGTEAVSATGGTVGAFSSADAGTYAITVSGLTLTGANASNYQLASTSYTDSEVKINPKSITLSGAVNFTNRTYDGTTALSIASNPTYTTGSAANQVLVADAANVTITGGSGILPSKNAGTYSVTASGFSLSGTKAGNYVLASDSSTDTSVVISKANIAVTGTSGATKTYDGTTAVVTDTPYTYSGIIAGDSVNFTGSVVYASKDSGVRAINQGSLALAGTDANNYQINWSAGSGTINKATLSMKANDAIKVITDTDPTLTASYQGFVAGEDASVLTSPTVTRTEAGEGAGSYALTPSATALNYDITSIAGTLTIAPADTLVVQLNDATRVYGNANPSLTAVNTAKYYSTSASELKSFSLTETGGVYSGNDGLGATITFTPTTLAKTTSDVGNYAITTQVVLTGSANYNNALISNGMLSITPLQANLTANAVTKVYDGNTKVTTPVASVSNKVGTDDVAVSGVGFYNSKDVASAASYNMSSLSLSGAKAGNYYISSADMDNGISGSGTITAKTITVGATASDKVYDRSTAATIALSSSGVVSGDTVVFSGSGAFADWNAGNGKTVNVSSITKAGADASNYTLNSTTATTTASITPKIITFTGIADDKVYDATTTARVTDTLSGVISGDTVTASHATAKFSDKNAGQNKTVTVNGIAIDNSNYTITDTAATLADITPANLTITAVNDTKVYDGTTLSSAAPTTSGLLGGDTISNLSQYFASKDAGTRALSVKSGYLLTDGNNGGNYTVTLASVNGTINQKALSMSANNAAKVINDTDPTLTAKYSGFIAGENEGVLTSVSITRAAGNTAGTYTITPSASATNYLITPTTGTFTIEGADKLLIQLGDASAVYGSIPSYTITSAKYYSSSKAQLMSLNVIKNANGSYTADDGLGGGLNFTLASSGTNVGNQTIDKATATQIGTNFNSFAFDSANLAITPKLLQLGIGGSVSKVYDGGLTASGATMTSSSVVGTDNITITGNALFSDKNVGSGKIVTIGGITIGGTSLANYYIDATTLQNGVTTTGAITAKALTVMDTVAANKVYDGTTTATLTNYGSLVGVVTGDTVTINGTGASATFANANAGNTKVLTVSSLALSGVDMANYTVIQPTGVTANITKKMLTVAANNDTHVYDGNTYSGGNGVTYSGFVGSETSAVLGGTLGYTGTSQSAKNVGVYAITAGGLDATNYNFNYVSGQLSITPKTITITGATVGNKVYDGTTAASVSAYGTLNDVVAGDTVTINQGGVYALFADKNAGTAKAASIYGYALSGASASNYVLDTTTETTTADITKAALTVTANNDARFVTQMDDSYYGGVRISGFVNGEDERVLSGGAFVTRDNAATHNNAGSYTGVLTPQGYTSDNYAINYAKGDYTIVAAGKMIVKAENVSTDYSVAANYGISSVEYEAGGTVKSLNFVSQSGNTFTYNDGSGNVIFTISPTGTVNSTSGNIKVGSYNLTGTGFSETTGNFNPADISQDIIYSGILTVQPKALTASVTTGSVSKEYDGKTDLNTAGITVNLNGYVVGDSGTLTKTGSYASKNAATDLSYTLNYALSGTDAANYYMAGGGTYYGTDGIITKKVLSIAGVSVADREYDGTTTATFASYGTGLTGAISGDSINIDPSNVSATFADKNVAYSGGSVVAKNVSVSGYSLSGSDASNYTLTAPNGLTAKITPKSLTVTGLTVADKIYDATTTATIVDNGIINKISGDNVGFSTVATFTNKNVESSKQLNLDFTLSGSDAANYTLVDRTNVASSAMISAKALTVSGLTVASKEYDGSVSATLSNAGAIDKITVGSVTDDVTLSTVATFNNKNVEDSKTVSLDYTLSGADKDNYSLSDVNNIATNALITQKILTVSDWAVADKTYDGLVNVTLSNVGTVNKINGDDLSFDTTATFNNKNVEAIKTINLVYSLGGSDALNYSLANQSNVATSAKINKLTLNNQFIAENKTYDGNRNATVAATMLNKVGSDDLTLSYGTTLFSDKNAGTAKTVTISGLSIAGADVGNYQLSGASATTTADINKKMITSITGITASDKTYDATTMATLSTGSATITDKIVGDSLTIANAVGSFADKNVVLDSSDNPIAKTVTIRNFVLGGADAGNYDIGSYTATTTAKINKAALTMSANSESVVYSDAMPTFSANYSGFVGGEDISVLGGKSITTNANDTHTAGTYTITPTATSGNYEITFVNGVFKVIPADTLLVKIDNKEITYGDATPAFTVSSAKYYKSGTGLVTLTSTNSGNDYTLADGGSTAATFTIGSNGVNAGNYTIAGSDFVQTNNNFTAYEFDTGTLTIKPKALTVTASGASKVYDGTVIANGAQLGVNGKVGTDNVIAVGSSGVFASKNAGQNLAYTIYGVSLDGVDKNNYYIDTTGGTTFTAYDGEITKKALSISGVIVGNKVYDGAKSATVTTQGSIVPITGDSVSVVSNGLFSDKNVGTNKTVTLSHLLSGTDADNYTLENTTTTASISRLSSVTWVGGTNGNWFDPTNWVGGAVPDLSNVSNVVIPTGVTVSFDTTGATGLADATSAVNIDSLGTLGSMNMANGALNVANTMTLSSLTQSGGTVSTNSLNITDSFSQSGTTGTITVVNNAVINQMTGDMSLGNISTGGTLSATAQNGNITQVAGTALVPTGLATFNATGNIGLGGSGNNFSTIALSGQNVSFNDSVGGVILDDVTTTGPFDLTSSGGDITQNAGSVLSISGESTLNAGADSVILSNAANDFHSAVNVIGANIVLADTNGIELGNITASGTLGVNATGDITQSVGTAIVTGGNVVFASMSGDITLGEGGNNFGGSFGASGNSISLTNYNQPLSLGTIVSQSALNIVTNNQPITQSSGSTLTANGTASMNAGTSTIALTNPGNDYSAITLIGSSVTVAETVDEAAERLASQTSSSPITNVIATITNGSVIPIPVQPEQTVSPIINVAVNNADQPSMTHTTLPQINGSNEFSMVVGMPTENEVLRLLTLEELRLLTSNSAEIKIPLGNSGNIVLVDGGVRLPDGISQELYVVDIRKRNQGN